ncbi:hypothetical protein BM43_4414 [Burkholderia gladioli]|jgi:hypothetical protein|uniref:Uncharacterized protein n=1 Tax=Burkholderia gladioli TaxID=28095 RepID=A0AAW3EXE5_BURGA|nr:hypothetical protein BM43_4414 [Burkholderia gladioli]TWC64716.1 hypothetical protein FB600_11542 [Burkholderia sp. SJZ089]TWC97550.1 hypothetical protein FBX98_115132 [Burkholderia sp. SJZ115]TWD00678.1 hypothetical protein FB601_11542 [Burkholderia sp. SJZ091]KAF1059768.1 hypothetical protein LvStA_06369 [Burkholderia gladioli]
MRLSLADAAPLALMVLHPVRKSYGGIGFGE